MQLLQNATATVLSMSYLGRKNARGYRAALVLNALQVLEALSTPAYTLVRTVNSYKACHAYCVNLVNVRVVYADTTPRPVDTKPLGQCIGNFWVVGTANSNLAPCTIVAECHGYCAVNALPWKEKCTWLTCGDCSQCYGECLLRSLAVSATRNKLNS